MQVQNFVRQLNSHGITAYYGVPDSLLKDFCAYVSHQSAHHSHVTAANEGNAIGLACGHYLATGLPALVYMQNSGLGNCVNPLLSLLDEEVYSIPALLLIGWRGEPGIKDEPQHAKQGKITLSLLETMGIEYRILSSDETEARQQIDYACDQLNQQRKPFALIARKNVFGPFPRVESITSTAELTREQAVKEIAAALHDSDLVVSTTGQLSRELYEFRTASNLPHRSDFLTVGGMGHASSIALGIAMNRPERRVICMDGDGALLMHMGAAAIIGQSAARNMRHIVFNNAAHDSVGGQPTVADKLQLQEIATACGYQAFYQVSTPAELKQILPHFLNRDLRSMLEVKVRCGARPDLGRPNEIPTENKKSFMDFAEEGRSYVYPGAIQELRRIIDTNGWHRVLLFTTKGRLASTDNVILPLLRDTELTTYTDISPNPTAEEVETALSLLTEKYDAIIALGGGSCIDFAKLYRAASDNCIGIREHFRKNTVLIRQTPLIAIPTTAGTGSEATRFAVVYLDGEKYSLDAPAVMPDYALVDSSLMAAAPAYLKASCGMDAMAQAIEGFWAKGATSDSDTYAKEAIRLCRDHLIDFVNNTDTSAAAHIAKASWLAGKCISIARTTAAHALSYKVTQLYGVPHGHAVALSLPGLAEFHALHAQEGSVLEAKMKWLTHTLNSSASELRNWFHALYADIHLPYRLNELGIKSATELASGVNTARLANNPMPLSKEQMEVLFD